MAQKKVVRSCLHQPHHLLHHVIFILFHTTGCVCHASQCVMRSKFDHTSHPPRHWSSCSMKRIQDFASDSCLHNKPRISVSPPHCGDGIQEELEQCDCGTVAECTNPCCNASTCQLVPGAQCSTGPCCTSQCKLARYGKGCRPSRRECDIEEYCSGYSNECPPDEHARDGTSCHSNTGYCFNGECPTSEAHCQALFGKQKS